MLTAIELVKAVRAAADRPSRSSPPDSEAATGDAKLGRPPQGLVAVGPGLRRSGGERRGASRTEGRILVEPSGTEPRLRIMVEGDRLDEISEIARELDELAQARLN